MFNKAELETLEVELLVDCEAFLHDFRITYHKFLPKTKKTQMPALPTTTFTTHAMNCATAMHPLYILPGEHAYSFWSPI